CADIDAVLVALPAAEVAGGDFALLCQQYQLTKVQPPVVGADERQGSIHCALEALAANAALHHQTEIVAIHDAVRPFATPAMITATVAAARAHGGAICA